VGVTSAVQLGVQGSGIAKGAARLSYFHPRAALDRARLQVGGECESEIAAELARKRAVCARSRRIVLDSHIGAERELARLAVL